MFDELYEQPVTCDRHRASPNLGERLRYLNALRDQGYSKKSLREAANKLLVVIRELGADLRPGVTPVQIRAAALRFTQGRRRYASRPEPRRSGHYFQLYATNWLRFLGWLKEPAPVVPPYAPLLEEFCTWMREDRNLAEETIKTKRFHIGTLLRWHDSRGGKAQKLGLAEVDAFLAEGETKHWSRRTMATAADSLRIFFRYGASRGWWCPTIAEAIEGPMVYREESLPSGPSWDDVGRLLASLRPDDPTDIRDRAMILLMAVYGFRVGEVERLSLDDIKWEQRELLVCRSKSGARQKYPLVGAIAEAIWRYLRIRPNCPTPSLFVTMKAPIKRVSRYIIYNGVANRLFDLGVSLNHCGPHSLRHACAARLVSQGLSLKEIGDHLGHRSTAATRIYAKVDMPNLREVASFDLGGLA